MLIIWKQQLPHLTPAGKSSYIPVIYKDVSVYLTTYLIAENLFRIAPVYSIKLNPVTTAVLNSLFQLFTAPEGPEYKQGSSLLHLFKGAESEKVLFAYIRIAVLNDRAIEIDCYLNTPEAFHLSLFAVKVLFFSKPEKLAASKEGLLQQAEGVHLS